MSTELSLSVPIRADIKPFESGMSRLAGMLRNGVGEAEKHLKPFKQTVSDLAADIRALPAAVSEAANKMAAASRHRRGGEVGQGKGVALSRRWFTCVQLDRRVRVLQAPRRRVACKKNYSKSGNMTSYKTTTIFPNRIDMRSMIPVIL